MATSIIRKFILNRRGCAFNFGIYSACIPGVADVIFDVGTSIAACRNLVFIVYKVSYLPQLCKRRLVRACTFAQGVAVLSMLKGLLVLVH
jgi:hypothetical protein